jgi:N utilization substance protein A
MSTSPIAQTIDILSREKGIDPQVIISAIEDAVVTAARKQFKSGQELRARYDEQTGDIDLFALMTVVEAVQDSATEITLQDVEEMGVEGAEVGDQLEFPLPKEELGRIAAQTAKQIIFQKVREAERNNIYDEYIDRVGELVHGFVKRFEGGRIITDLGKIEAVLPKTQQSRAEAFSQGERIRVVINSVSKDTKGPQVEVSRTSPELLKRLFEMEVPEIYDGTVQIKAAVREPGDRAKIAVISTERDVDPVGACVGMKGSRVQAIIRELRGERIDIIEWSEDPAVFAANALSPAKVSKVEINSFEEKKLTITVPEDQLSLAIGKKGQNVRLAAKLVGWHIDIRSAEAAARAAALQLEAVMAGGEATLTDIRESLALDQITAERLKDRGIETIEQLAELTVDQLVDAIDVSLDQANEIIERSHRLLAQKQAREARAAEAAAAGEGLDIAAEEEAEAALIAGEGAEPAVSQDEIATGELATDEAVAESPEEPVTYSEAEAEATQQETAATESEAEEDESVGAAQTHPDSEPQAAIDEQVIEESASEGIQGDAPSNALPSEVEERVRNKYFSGDKPASGESEAELQESASEAAEESAGDTASGEDIELTSESETPAVAEAGEQDGEDEGKPSGSAATSRDE